MTAGLKGGDSGEMDSIYERVAELILLNAPEEPQEPLGEDTRLLEDLGYDSIAMMSLLVDVEEEYGFEAEDMEESLKAFETVKSFVAFVKENVQ